MSAPSSSIRSLHLLNLLFPHILCYSLLAFSYNSRVIPSSLRPGSTPCTWRTSSDTPLILSCSCCKISPWWRRRVLIVPVSSSIHECVRASSPLKFPFWQYLCARCSRANRTDMCVMVFKCPGCRSVVRIPSISNILITRVESPLFLNIDDLDRFFLPREELAGARRGPRPSPGATKILPNPLDAWHAPPPVDTEGGLLATIRLPPHAVLRLPHLGEGRPCHSSSYRSRHPCGVSCVAASPV